MARYAGVPSAARAFKVTSSLASPARLVLRYNPPHAKSIGEYRRAQWDEKAREVMERLDVRIRPVKGPLGGAEEFPVLSLDLVFGYGRDALKEVMYHAFAVEQDLLERGRIPRAEATKEHLFKTLFGLLTERLGKLEAKCFEAGVVRPFGGSKDLKQRLEVIRKEWATIIENRIVILLDRHAPSPAESIGTPAPIESPRPNPTDSAGGVHVVQGGTTRAGVLSKHGRNKRIFLAHRFAEESLIGQLKTYIRERGFEWTEGRREDLGSISEDILNKIRECGFFLAVMTRMERLLRFRISHTVSSWLIEEKGAALAYGHRPLIMVEQGVERHYVGFLQGDDQMVWFTRKNFAKKMVEAMNMIESTYEKIGRNGPPSALVPELPTHAANSEVSANLQRRAIHEQLILNLQEQYLSKERWAVMRSYLEARLPVIGERRVGAAQYSNRDTEDFIWFFDNVGRMVQTSVIPIEAVKDRWLHDIELLLTNRSVVDYLMKARDGNPNLFKNLLSLGGELSEWVSAERKGTFKECLGRIEHAKEVLNQPI